MPERILMIEDDASLSAMVSEYLDGFGMNVSTKPTAVEGLQLLWHGEDAFDGIILDVMLPDLDGFEVCRQIRAASVIPILMLTARGDEMDRIVGLELGADDYLPKPFNPRELLARLRAILRRSRSRGPADTGRLCFGRLDIDEGSRSVRVDGEERALTSYQFEPLSRGQARCVPREGEGTCFEVDLVSGLQTEAS